MKLTEKQARTIEKFMNNGNVLELTINELHKVIDGEYEIERVFEVEDWVAYKPAFGKGEIAIVKVLEIDESDEFGILTDFKGTNGVNQNLSKEFIRHATPEEIAEEKQRRW